jgi:DNA ligase (NAD+)
VIGKNKAAELAQKIETASSAYYLGTPIMSDAEFDLMIDLLREIDPVHPVLANVGTDVSTTPWPIVLHQRPMGSLYKVNTEEEYRKWASKYSAGSVCISEKLDGLSLSLIYSGGELVQAITRGDGVKGEDITPNIRLVKGVLQNIPKLKNSKIAIRGEAILLLEDYRTYFPRTVLEDGSVDNSNPRNCVAVVRRKRDAASASHVTFLAYDIEYLEPERQPITKKEIFDELCELGFGVPIFSAGSVDSAWRTFTEYQQKLRAERPYEIDGLVVEENDRAIFKMHGESSGRPRAARAIKFAAELGESTLRNISYQIGRTGVVTPIGEIDPIFVGGVRISYASLMNISECLRLGVMRNSDVIIERCNDVIPRVIKCEHGEPFTLPTEIEGHSLCLRVEDGMYPILKSTPFTMEGLKSLGVDPESTASIFLFCDDENHPQRKLRRLDNFVKTLNIKGVGEKAIQSLINLGKLNSPADFYLLSLGDWTSALNSVVNAEKVMKELSDKSKNVSLPTLIKSVGMTFFGENTSKLIETKFPRLEDWYDLKIEDILGIKGVGESKAVAAIKGLKENKTELLRLKMFISTAASATTCRSSVRVCFSGARLPKELLSKFINCGYVEAVGVSKETDILVVADIGSNSGKIKKAKELGTKLISMEDFMEELREAIEPS